MQMVSICLFVKTFLETYILHTVLKVEECVLLVNNYIELQQKRDREKEVD